MKKCSISIFFVYVLLAVWLTGCTTPEDNVVTQNPNLSGNVTISGSYNVSAPFVANTNAVIGTGALTVQWLISDSFDGVFIPITEADGSTSTVANIADVVFTANAEAARKWVQVKVSRTGYRGSLISRPYIILPEGIVPAINEIKIIYPDYPSALRVLKGEEVQLDADILGKDVIDIQNVMWSIISSHSNSTSLDHEGLLKIGSEEANSTITIRASSMFDPFRFKDIIAYITLNNYGQWKGEDITSVPTVRIDDPSGRRVFFVATDGNNDTGNGTLASPWRTITYANTQMENERGDTLYVRGGSWGNVTSGNRTMNKRGKLGYPTLYSAYPPDLDPDWDWGESPHGPSRGRPVFTSSVSATGPYVHLYGFVSRGGISTSGNHNTLENNVTWYGGIGAGTDYTLTINNDAFQQGSYTDLEDNMGPNGMGQHYSGNFGNVYYGNRVWGHADDGFDSISCYETYVVERNWFAYNGCIYREEFGENFEHMTTSLEGLESVEFNWGRGNNAKCGGFNMNNALSSERLAAWGKTFQVVRFNMAIGAPNAGITSNFHPYGSYFSYNTAWNNNNNLEFFARKGQSFIKMENNMQDAARVVNARSIVVTGNVAIPGGPVNNGWNVCYLDYDSGFISANISSAGMQQPHGRGQNQIWNNSWEMVDNGAKLSHGEHNWIEGIMLHGQMIPAPDLWIGDPWPTTIEKDGKTWILRSGAVNGGTNWDTKRQIYFNQGSAGPRGTPQNPRLAWDHLGYWKNWDDVNKDIVDLPFTEADIMSFDENLFLTPRNKDGSLPDIAFLRPVPGSILEGKGYTAADNNEDGTTGRYRWYLWKYRAGANPSLDIDFNYIPGTPVPPTL